ncbi:MAG: carotenoid biosynthesis protein [Bacteroidia bacterium]
MSPGQKDKKFFITATFLVVIYLAGVIGLLSSYKNLFLFLTPFSLLLSASLVFINHKDFNKNFYVFCFTSFLTGFFIEVIGTKTGLIFGNYTYGNTLGIKLFDVPVIIGINWLVLIYCIGIICSKLNIPFFLKSFIGAGMLVILDFFIEVVAVKYDFWGWQCSAPPVKNFIGWFVVSFVLLLIFNQLKFNKVNPIAKVLFIVQLIFFTLLTIL